MTPDHETIQALELQIKRLVSDRESDKQVYKETHRELHMAIENIKKAVFGNEETIGLRPRVLQMEESVNEMKKTVLRLEKALYVFVGAFAVIKLVLEFLPKHLSP